VEGPEKIRAGCNGWQDERKLAKKRRKRTAGKMFSKVFLSETDLLS
jgi:hypothetical protein